MPCSIIVTVQEDLFFLCLNENLLHFHLCLSSFHWAPPRRAWPDFFTSSYQQFSHWQDPSKPSLRTEQSQLPVSPPMRNAPRLCSSKALPLLYQRTQNRTQHSRCGLTHQHWVKDKNPLSQAAGNTLPNAQNFVSFLCPRFVLLVHVHQNHQVLSCKAAFQLVITQSVPDILPPGAGLCHFPLLNLIKFPISYFSRKLVRSPWMAAQPSGLSITPLNFISSANLLGVHSVPWFKSVVKRLNSICPRISPWSTTPVSDLWKIPCCWSQPSELAVQLPFSSFTLSVYLFCTSPVYLWGCYKRQYWKPH